MSVMGCWPGSGVHADSQVFTLPSFRGRQSDFSPITGCPALQWFKTSTGGGGVDDPCLDDGAGCGTRTDTATIDAGGDTTRSSASTGSVRRSHRTGVLDVVAASASSAPSPQSKQQPLGAGKLPTPAAPRPRAGLPQGSTFSVVTAGSAAASPAVPSAARLPSCSDHALQPTARPCHRCVMPWLFPRRFVGLLTAPTASTAGLLRAVVGAVRLSIAVPPC